VGVRTGVIGPMGSGTSEPVVLGPNEQG